ncbi:family 43 glycosylhydrolase [Streptomyces sp. NPDC020192]|uniref:family 43 glycosylhydrolase n=1 Tax=Streptomyces sp. NPDC020192 TaxID=3365066 RepID=UPI003790BF45
MAELVNPVIRGFAPDPSLVRAGDWYYLATSSFEWFPTIPIHRSRDLARWEYAGHVEGAAPGGSLAGVPDSGGIWAPSLSWDGTRFWVTYAVVRSVGTPYFDLDVHVCTAPDVAGPWTAPRRVPSHGFDPALFHEEGRLWLLNLQNDHRPGGRRFCGIVATELNPSTLTPVGGTRLLLQHDRLIEGPKLLKRNGWYVLLLAEGGTGFEHGVRVARSRHLTGPYELDARPLLTSRDDPSWPLQKAGHAELVHTPDDEWYLGHLTARPLPTPTGPRCPLGRETAIQAVTWDENDWPRLRHGDCRPAIRVAVPRGGDGQDAGEPEPADFEPAPAPGRPEPSGDGRERDPAHSGNPLAPGRPGPSRDGRDPKPATPGDTSTPDNSTPTGNTPTPSQPDPTDDQEPERATPGDTPTPGRSAPSGGVMAPGGSKSSGDGPDPESTTADALAPGPPKSAGGGPEPKSATTAGVLPPGRPRPAGDPLAPGRPEPAGEDPESKTTTAWPQPTGNGPEPESATTGAMLTPGRPALFRDSLAPGRSEPSWYTLRSPVDPSWIDLTSRPGWIRLRGRHGPDSLWAQSLLARRITEHRAEARVSVEARPSTFTQAAGLLLWYNTAAYFALDLTWAEPEGEEQCGQQWQGGGRSVLALTVRDEDETRRVTVMDVDASGPLTLGVGVERGAARFWYAHHGTRRSVGPALDFTRLSDDHGSRLRFTGAMAAIHAVDLVGASFTADFTGFRLDCAPD